MFNRFALREERLSVPAVEVRHYQIGDDPVPVDSADQVPEEYGAVPSEQAPASTEALVRVGIVRMGSELAPMKLQSLLEWARRRASNARRFFAGS